ncbi:hypothetical protein Rcae01_06489 [Novipirellula caenicola]|uniref:Uncharacterized protein n=1 Tax=Novipirellula caenicola TaxID=1536901 RepID=A0ABP9W0R8_9BACT
MKLSVPALKVPAGPTSMDPPLNFALPPMVIMSAALSFRTMVPPDELIVASLPAEITPTPLSVTFDPADNTRLVAAVRLMILMAFSSLMVVAPPDCD